MINKLLLTLSLFVSLSFGNIETISLTGDFAKNDLSNPFRALLEKKDKSISIFSQNRDVVLKVENDLKNSDIFNRPLKEYPSEIILKNSSVENVLKVYYSEEYKVEVKEKADVIVNVLGGKIELEHFFDDDKNIRPILKKIIVNLNVEIIKNGIKTTQNITLDDKLGKEDTSYKWTMREDTFKRNPLSLFKNVPEIIENQIYILKGL